MNKFLELFKHELENLNEAEGINKDEAMLNLLFGMYDVVNIAPKLKRSFIKAIIKVLRTGGDRSNL